MKKTSFKIRTILVGLLATIVTVSFTTPVFAANKTKARALPAVSQPVVKFLSGDYSQSLFSVTLENEKPVKFEVTIQDETGVQLFKDTYDAASFSKVFQLVNEGGENNIPAFTFQVKELQTGVTHNFVVSSKTAYVKEVEITKI